MRLPHPIRGLGIILWGVAMGAALFGWWRLVVLAFVYAASAIWIERTEGYDP